MCWRSYACAKTVPILNGGRGARLVLTGKLRAKHIDRLMGDKSGRKWMLADRLGLAQGGRSTGGWAYSPCVWLAGEDSQQVCASVSSTVLLVQLLMRMQACPRYIRALGQYVRSTSACTREQTRLPHQRRSRPNAPVGRAAHRHLAPGRRSRRRPRC